MLGPVSDVKRVLHRMDLHGDMSQECCLNCQLSPEGFVFVRESLCERDVHGWRVLGKALHGGLYVEFLRNYEVFCSKMWSAVRECCSLRILTAVRLWSKMLCQLSELLSRRDSST